MPGLSFITMLAYDYRYCYLAIRSYYDIADEIILGLDEARLTWMKQPFDIDLAEVQSFIDDIDTQKKIRIVQGNFHAADHPMANDNAERSFLSHHCTPGNWVVQIDADEILLNPADFRQWLLANNPVQFNVFARWVSIFKVFGQQVLMINPPGEAVPVATMIRGQYTGARLTAQQGVMSPLQLLHFSWGRTPEELLKKLTNWSHAQDFNVRNFFDFWQSVTLENYTQAHNFHPLNGPAWQSLQLATIGFTPAEPYVKGSLAPPPASAS